MATYNESAVQRAIDAHNRRPRGGRISRAEARLIHTLLKGHAAALTPLEQTLAEISADLTRKGTDNE